MNGNFTFLWLGSTDHYDADCKNGQFQTDYCCEAGLYEIEPGIDDPEDWALWNPKGDLLRTPCDNLSPIVDLFITGGEDALSTDALYLKGVRRCEWCGGLYPVTGAEDPCDKGRPHVADLTTEERI